MNNGFKKIIDLILKIFIISVSISGAIIILIIALVIAGIYLKPYGDFWNVKNNNFEELNALTDNADMDGLLLYRRKIQPNAADSLDEICYVHYVKLNSTNGITEKKLIENGYKPSDKSNCVAQDSNLTELTEITFVAPFFHYLGYSDAFKFNKIYLVYGSTAHLDVSTISAKNGQIWQKQGHEIVIYPGENIIQKNSLFVECFDLLGMCN